jgi:glutathionyl-hydroquinone reductase
MALRAYFAVTPWFQETECHLRTSRPCLVAHHLPLLRMLKQLRSLIGHQLRDALNNQQARNFERRWMVEKRGGAWAYAPGHGWALVTK